MNKSAIQNRLWGENGIIPLNGDYYRYIVPGFHPWDMDQALIDAWDQTLEPGFHPWDMDDRALIDAWDQTLEPQWRRRILQFM